tara:strand:+ start:1469 stop:1684 length:216 start_codon:yes stop_codon:yes gene_type:complete
MSMISIEAPMCSGCNKSSVILLTETQFEGVKAWLAGVAIQTALPDLSPELRDTLKTGWHADCFDEAFGTEE